MTIRSSLRLEEHMSWRISLTVTLFAAMLAIACGGSKEEVDASEPEKDVISDVQKPEDIHFEVPSSEFILDIPPDVVDEEFPLPDVQAELEPLPDLQPELEPPPDVGPDYTPLVRVAFRVNSMVFTEPAFCYMMMDNCVPVLDMVNLSLAQAVVDGEMNVVGLFEPFGPGEVSKLTMAMATCNFDDPLDGLLPMGYCTFGEESVPAEYDDVQISTEASCAAGENSFDAPCFASGEADLALEFSGIVLGLSNVTVSGHISDWPDKGKIAPGLIHGWLPEELAKTVQVQIPGDMPVSVSLYELLENSETVPQVVDGHNAWPVTIEIEAYEVGFID